jgi:hypothetical protein
MVNVSDDFQGNHAPRQRDRQNDHQGRRANSGLLSARELSPWRRQSSDWNRISGRRQDDDYRCAKCRGQDFREQHKSQCDPNRSLQVLPFERPRRNGDGHRFGVRSLRVLFQGKHLPVRLREQLRGRNMGRQIMDGAERIWRAELPVR